jgi:hypothetical protein
LSHSAALRLAFVLTAFCATAALAEPAAEAAPETQEPSALTVLLPHQHGRSLCYVSRGAPATFPLEDIPARKKLRHLTVRRFLFELSAEKHQDDDTTTPPTQGERYYGYRLLAQVVGKRSRLLAVGDCGSGDLKGFGCGVECDGGSMTFEPLQGGETLRMRVSDSAKRFRMSWGCGDGRYEVLRRDPEAPAVRMARATAKACAPIAREAAKRNR